MTDEAVVGWLVDHWRTLVLIFVIGTLVDLAVRACRPRWVVVRSVTPAPGGSADGLTGPVLSPTQQDAMRDPWDTIASPDDHGGRKGWFVCPRCGRRCATQSCLRCQP